MSLVACAQGEGGWEQKHYPALKSKPDLQATKKKIRRFFHKKKYFFFFFSEFPETQSTEGPAPVLASQCLTLELGCASPPL